MQKWNAFRRWPKFDKLWFIVECISSIILLCVEYYFLFLRWVIWNVENGGKLQRSLLFTCFWITIQWWSNTSLISFWIAVVSTHFEWRIHSNTWFDSKFFSLHKMKNCEKAKNELWRPKSTVFPYFLHAKYHEYKFSFAKCVRNPQKRLKCRMKFFRKINVLFSFLFLLHDRTLSMPIQSESLSKSLDW